jgi:hypothetical protein
VEEKGQGKEQPWDTLKPISTSSLPVSISAPWWQNPYRAPGDKREVGLAETFLTYQRTAV